MHELTQNVSFEFDIDDLANAIASGKAVVYTGAGTSIPADLPGWRDFLAICLERAKNSRLDPTNAFPDGWWEKAAELMRQEDYLTSAGILQQVIGQSLETYVWDTFGTASEPTDIHRAIARIPFSLAITTNYDRLLESAYPSRPNVWTWRDPQALFSSIKHRRFSVVKIHGDVGNGPSLVLTKNQYRDLMHLNKAFNECLISLLSLRSFLFVGTSLKDHDLTRLMDMAKLTYGADFGPHYAICFENEVDHSMAKLLRDSYNINCVICQDPGGDDQWMTKSVTSFLTFLSGKVSKRQASKSIPLAKLEHPVFSLRDASHEIAGIALSVTSADRSRLAFVREPKLPALQLVSSLARSGEDEVAGVADPFQREELHLSPHGYLGESFLNLTDSDASDYVPNVDQYLRRQVSARKKHDQITGYSQSKSVLTTPVFADGERVGVLSVESTSTNAFTNDHLLGLLNCSKAAGAMYLEYRHRQRSADAVLPYLASPHDFEETMNRSRQIRELQLNFLLYEIDYASGRLVARYSSDIQTKEEREFGFGFAEETCLAARVFRNKSPEYVLPKDADQLSSEGAEFFNIKPPVFATPVRVSGSVSTVLVCWSRRSDLDGFVGDNARIASLASLIVNSPESAIGHPSKRRAQRFVTRMNRNLKKYDGGQNWTRQQMRSARFLDNVFRVAMDSLVDSACGIRRVRYWQRQDGNAATFKLIRSVEAGAKSATPLRNKYVNKNIETGDDAYCRYTLSRAKLKTFESAQFQHAKMFGVEDPNMELLEKDPDGIWLVAPVQKDGHVFGFFSADNHINRKEIQVPEEVLEMQRCALDVSVRLVEKIVAYQALLKRKKRI